MTDPHHKLYGPKQLLLITAATVAGMGLFLFRQFHENGRIGSAEVVATIITLVITVVITVFIVRKGNRQE